MPSIGASGGLIFSWNDQIFHGQLTHSNDYSISITFTSNPNGDSWLLSNIYGPCQHNDRRNLIEWLKCANLGWYQLDGAWRL